VFTTCIKKYNKLYNTLFINTGIQSIPQKIALVIGMTSATHFL
jgi:hypothetical protein